MNLNLPIFEPLASCNNLLIAGMGGGFDIFCALPIYFELQRRGQRAHLANFSFSDIQNFDGGIRLSETLAGITADYAGRVLYFPELHLARWFAQQRGEAITIWAFHKTGARPLLADYRRLVEHLDIDGILLMDGGVDCLMRGDEAETGTLIEDAVSLYAVNALTEIPVRLIACLGLGAEQYVHHAHVFENIATLTAAGGMLGVCSLTPQMDVYRDYEAAVQYAHNQEYQDSSVINASVISAVRGHYGNYHLTAKTRDSGSRLWISPLMPLYWFFDATVVAAHNLYLAELAHTESFLEALEVYQRLNIRKRPAAMVEL